MASIQAPQSRELLSAEECLDAYEKVKDLKSHWTRRNADLPFYTLGAASYLDAANGGLEAYGAKARSENPLLVRHFGWILDRLASALTDEMGTPFEYDEHLGLPGFHIFSFHDRFRRPLGDIHFDLEYKLVGWSKPSELDRSAHLSLTLPIKLPACGGGLRVWPLYYDGTWGRANVAQMDQIVRTEPVSYRYRAGDYVVHSGHQLHQIAPEPNLVHGDERVTLQGHAMPVSGRYILYW